MAENITRQVSAAEITFDPDGTPIVFTPDMGGTVITYSLSLADVFEEPHGNLPVDKISSGFDGSPMIAAPLATMTALRLKEIFGVTEDTNEYLLQNSNGESLKEGAQKVVVKPMVNNVADPDESTWIWFPLGSRPVFRSLSHTYDRAGQRVWQVEIYGFPGTEVGYEGVPIVIGQNAPI